MGKITKKLFGGDDGLIIRLRIFDQGHHVMTATVEDRGQRDAKVIVKKKDYGVLGDETKIAFIIDPDVPCKYFGNVQERDYDIRNSAQLADLMEICPDL